MAASPLSSRAGVRASGAAVLWILALFALLLWQVDSAEPGAALEWVELAKLWLARGFLGVAILTIVVLAAWPPFWTGTRLWWRDLRAWFMVDKAPMYQALTRLEHFETADEHFIVAQTLYRMRERGSALAHLNRAIELDDTVLKCFALRGRVRIERGDLAGGIEDFQRVVAKDPGHGFGESLLRLGLALTAAREDDAARTRLEQHAADNGPERRALVARAILAQRADDSHAATELLREAAAEPRDGEHLPIEAAHARARARAMLRYRWAGGES